jgi:ribonucleoside-diphosphate reductase alpha chain
MGMTANSDIPFAKSLVDYIFRWLGLQFVEGYREQNLPQRPVATPTKEESCDSTDASSGLKRDSGNTKISNETTTTVLPDSEKAKTEGATSPKTPDNAMGDVSMSYEFGTQSMAAQDPSLLENPSLMKSVLDQSNALLMGDAPACEECGSITVRNGTCYRCLNCGNSMGCS